MSEGPTGPGGDVLDRLRSFLGASAPVHVARHPVSRPAIADWCDAIGDTNPTYIDDEAATKSRHGGIVAPPASLDIWDRPGLPALAAWGGGRTADDPFMGALRTLDGAGYVGVVAVNSELLVARYPRPGDRVQCHKVVADISPAKRTALGVGHFVTTRHRYETTAGEHLGDLLFRILKFVPGSGKATDAPDAGRPAAPDADPALRPRPAVNEDNAFLFDGYRRHELRIPRCGGCGRLFFPPSPRCGACGSFDIGFTVAAGTGRLYSFATVHHPQVPGFRYPLVVGLVELAEGVRLLADLVGVPAARAQVGMPLVVSWLDCGSFTVPRFAPATPAPRTQTLRVADVAVGERLPLWTVPVTPTHIVAGALATRDFTEVHHDRDLAQAKGSADIFLNINTSLGMVQRYVTDFTGPDVFISALKVRLGAPAYPYLPLTFAGEVAQVDEAGGRAVIAVHATNDLGPHVTGTVELELAP